MPPLPKRKIGKSGPDVSTLGFGAMGLSASYDKVDDHARFAVLDRALELGTTFWGTSVISTKFAVTIANGISTIRSDPEYVRQACEKSLRRLGVDKIDLYYCHRVDKVTPIERTVEAMAELKQEGKIGAIGLSEVSAATIRRAEKVHHIDAVQLEYSPFALEIESEQIGILQTCRELGISVIAYSPQGRGFLTGQIQSPDDFEEGDFRKYAPRYSKENFPKNLRLVQKLQEFAARKDCTAGQLSLAWLLAQGPDITAIPECYVGAIYVYLTAEEAQEIRMEIEKVEVAGDRYPSVFQSFSFGDTPDLSS
ncbi:Aldo/keto reductase [Bimuria novae-zelandiae CBS 107.79]|uniref:Aldo/keto reductase n=1 Tax=Bimuria novae-zelandiae CBS 107.79 TaxID=1447943 RepID=A0A6A5VQF7_9PLEO|nr:Aldo/keto reductase [Bimuria novae-zelandiae CBS 107.79]